MSIASKIVLSAVLLSLSLPALAQGTSAVTTVAPKAKHTMIHKAASTTTTPVEATKAVTGKTVAGKAEEAKPLTGTVKPADGASIAAKPLDGKVDAMKPAVVTGNVAKPVAPSSAPVVKTN